MQFAETSAFPVGELEAAARRTRRGHCAIWMGRNCTICLGTASYACLSQTLQQRQIHLRPYIALSIWGSST